MFTNVFLISSVVTATFFSGLAFASVDYGAFAGEYKFVAGKGKNAQDCQGSIQVEADSSKNQITLFQTPPRTGNGFIVGFFNINQGPINDCCVGSDLFYHHDNLTTGSGTAAEKTAHEYYKVLRVHNVSLYKASLTLSGKDLTLRERVVDYEYPSKSSSRTCDFEKW